MIKLENCKKLLLSGGIIQKERLYTPNMRLNKYKLLKNINITLSNGDVIEIPTGFIWDLSTVPKFLWGIFAPDGNFELAALIHDYLYVNKLYTRKFNDLEMLKWSSVCNDSNKLSTKSLDNYIRYTACRAFGWIFWSDIIN